MSAAGYDWALPLYDPIVKLLGGDSARRVLIDQAALRSGQRVLEIGCGTGSLLLTIKRSYPAVDVVGLDPDPKALERAKRKADRAAVAISLDRGSSDALPYPDASFDRVFSCFMFHHLAGRTQKQQTLAEVRRVLRPGGRLHLADFVPGGAQKSGFLMRVMHPHHLADESEDRVLTLMRESGFVEAKMVGRRRFVFVLQIAYYDAPAA